jgi:hypothetical protein
LNNASVLFSILPSYDETKITKMMKNKKNQAKVIDFFAQF